MARPVASPEKFNNCLKSLNLELSSDDETYIGAKHRYTIRCKNHPEYIFTSLGSNILSMHGCRLCRDEKQKIDKLLPIEEVLRRLKEDGRGITFRDGFTYIDYHTPIPMVCPNHPEYAWVIRPLETLKGKGCPKCVGHAPLNNEEIDRRLATRNIQRLSDYVGPATSMMDFKCLIDGHRWSAQVHKVAGVNYTTGCPKCSDKIRWTPKAVDDWIDSNMPTIERISEFKAVSDQTTFKCKIDGYEWDGKFGNVRKGYGCPCCRKTKYWNTELVSMWLKANKPHLSLVGEFTKSNLPSRFRCTNHRMEFDRKFSYLLKGYDCPECTAGGGFKTNLKGYLYYAKIFVRESTFYKIGITNRKPEVRVAETRHNFELLESYEFYNGDIANRIETNILKQFSNLVQTRYKFSGSTECFIEDIRNYINFNEIINANIDN